MEKLEITPFCLLQIFLFLAWYDGAGSGEDGGGWSRKWGKSSPVQ